MSSYQDSLEQSVPVLDFTVSTAVPVSFTEQEKERILDEYIEAISEIGYLNNYSNPWLCHPMSEKNDLVADNLLDRLIDFLSFYRFFSEVENETVAVLTQRASLIQNIVDFANANGIDCRGIGESKRGKKGMVRTLGSFVKRIVILLKEAAQTQHWFMKSRFLWKRMDKTRTYTVIRTWFDSRSRPLMEGSKDVYFGRFPRFLKDNSRHILYFGEFAYGFEHEFANLKAGLEDPVILGRSLLHGLDFIKAFRFQYSAGRRLKLQTGVKVLDINVDIVFKNYFQQHAQDPLIRANYLTYLAAVKLMKKIKADHIYMPYENYAWEKLTRLAVAKCGKGVKVTSFQHAQVALNATKFFMGKNERSARFFPEKLVTLGEVTRNFLIKQKHYPEERLVTGCALRQDYAITSERVPRTANRRVLVQLWSVEKSARLINFIYASGIHPGKYNATLSPHPCNPIEVLIPHLDFKYEGNFPIFTGSLQESFKANDLVIYHGTTASLDALANGLPVINVEFDDFISVDPLFDFNDFKWTVRRPEELVDAIEKVYALSDEDYYERQKKGIEFVKNYFYPVNEKNLRKFL